MSGGNRFIERNSLQFVLSVVFTITAMLGALIMGIALNWHFNRSIMKIIEQDHNQIIEQVNMNIDIYLREIMRISDAACNHSVRDSDLAVTELTESFALIYELRSPQLISLALFDGEGALIAGYPYETLKEGISPKDTAWFRAARDDTETTHFAAPHLQNLYDQPGTPYSRVVSLSRAVSMRLNGEDVDGVLLVDASFFRVNRISDEAQIGPNGYIYITDAQGGLIYHPQQQLIYSGLRTENNLQEALLGDGSHRTRADGRNRVVTVKTVGYTGWKIVGVGYTDDIMPYTQTALLVALTFAVTLAVLILINHFVSSRITRPVRRLEQTVLMIDRVSMENPVPIGGAMEIRHLGQAIQALLIHTGMLMADIVAEQEKKSRYEFDMLQAQVNPHFLYNALDSIIRLIEWGDKRQAADMLKALSRFFRVTLSRGSGVIPVSNELEHVRSYLTIQKNRFQEKFRFTIEAEDRVLNLRVIKLILQPIAENCINHGIDFIDEDGLIAIRAYLGEDGALYLEVADDGRGIPPKRLAELFTKSLDRTKGTGVGLYNVQQRIRLFYGEEYGLTIHSEPDVGTCVTVRLPAQPYEEEQ